MPGDNNKIDPIFNNLNACLMAMDSNNPKKEALKNIINYCGIALKRSYLSREEIEKITLLIYQVHQCTDPGKLNSLINEFSDVNLHLQEKSAYSYNRSQNMQNLSNTMGNISASAPSTHDLRID